MPTLNAFDQLHADYAALAQRPPAALTPDRRRSLVFYRGKLALLAHTPQSFCDRPLTSRVERSD